MSVTLKDKLGELRRRHWGAVRGRRVGVATWCWALALGAALCVDANYPLDAWVRVAVDGALVIGVFVVVWQLRIPVEVRMRPDAWYAGLCDARLGLEDRPFTTAAELGNAAARSELEKELRRRAVERADEMAEKINMRDFVDRQSRQLVVSGVGVLMALCVLLAWPGESGAYVRKLAMRYAVAVGEMAAEGEGEMQSNHESGNENDKEPIANGKIISNDQKPSEEGEGAGGAGTEGEAGEDEGGQGGGRETGQTTTAGMILERLDVPVEEREHIAAMVDAAPAEYRERVAEYMLKIQRDARK